LFFSPLILPFLVDIDSSLLGEGLRVGLSKALSERIGINQSLLAEYTKGLKKPSVAQVKRILTGLQQIGRELADVQL